MHVRVIGQLQVERVQVWVPSREKERVVLAALVARRGSTLSSDQLADALWGESLPANPPKAVQNHVLRIRHALGPDAITTLSGGYALPDGATTDVDELADALRVGLDPDLDRAERCAALARARSLNRGQVFQDLLDWPDAQAEISRVDEQLCLAEEEFFALELAAGNGGRLIGDLRRIARTHPLRERRWGLLVAALRSEQRVAEACVALEEARRALHEGAGVDPGPGLLAHEAALGIDQASYAARIPDGDATRLQLVERVFRAWRNGRGRELDEAFAAYAACGDGDGASSAHRAAVLRSAWLLLRGDVSGAELEANRAAKTGSAEHDSWVSPIYQAQIAAIRREQGRFEEVRAAYEFVSDLGIPPVPLQRAFVAHGLMLLGNHELAARILAVEAADDFASVGDDDLRLTILSLYAEIASATHTPSAARALENALAPHTSQVVFDGAVCSGAVSRYLALLATLTERWENADDLLQDATAVHRRLGAPAWLARTLAERAEVISHRDDQTYPPEGLITEAIEIAARHDLTGVRADIDRAARTVGFSR